MCILSGIVYRAMPTKACGLLVLYFCHNIFVSYPSLLIPALITYKLKLILCFSVQFSCKLRSACQQKNGHCITSFLPAMKSSQSSQSLSILHCILPFSLQHRHDRLCTATTVTTVMCELVINYVICIHKCT